MNPMYLAVAVLVCYDNDNDAFIPERWAQEGLAILEESMVMANLVHRDFENIVADYGDVVNTRRPGEFRIRRKTDKTTLQQQDAKSTNVRVPLDQWFYDSFVIKDGERSKSFKDLVQVYLLPSMQVIARGVDRSVLGRVHAFLGSPTNRVGRLTKLDGTNSRDFLLEAGQRLSDNKAPDDNRRIVMAPATQAAFLKNNEFVRANERGDGGQTMARGRLGSILGFDTYPAQNVNQMFSGADTIDGSVTNAVAAGGSGSQAVSVSGYDVAVGSFAVIDGNDQPTYVTARTFSTDTTAVTLNEANKYSTLAAATIRAYKTCAVKDDNAEYKAGWSEGIKLDGWTAMKAPQVGQLIAFDNGSGRHTYTIIESELASTGVQMVHLDRPLDKDLANDDLAFPGPYGSFNWAFHRDAVALVTRPLARPEQQLGVYSAVAVYNNVAMRITMQYSIQAGGTIVNCDILGGVAVLDSRLCVPLLG
jgi:hypothetical protein